MCVWMEGKEGDGMSSKRLSRETAIPPLITIRRVSPCMVAILIISFRFGKIKADRHQKRKIVPPSQIFQLSPLHRSCGNGFQMFDIRCNHIEGAALSLTEYAEEGALQGKQQPQSELETKTIILVHHASF